MSTDSWTGEISEKNELSQYRSKICTNISMYTGCVNLN